MLTFPFISKLDAIYHYWIALENLTAIYVSLTICFVLLVMSLKLHALGESLNTFFPHFRRGWLYIVLTVLCYAGASIIPNWRDVEHFLFNSIVIRLYAMFVFPVICLAAARVNLTKAGVRSAR